jgi:hypothetical protein
VTAPKNKKRRQIQPRQKKFAQGLMAGKTKVRAALDAGYSESYAYKSSFAMIERPQIKTFLTEAYRAKGLTPDKIIQPVLDAYEAKIKVFSRVAGGLILTEDPDHEVRLKAYDRAVAAFGVIPREVEMPAPPRPGLVVIIGRASDQRQTREAKLADRPVPASKPIDVTFRRELTDDHEDTERKA